MDLGALIDGIELTLIGGGGVDGVRVCDLTEDSRTAMPGSLFVARSGTREEGAQFIEQAVMAGAVVVVTDDVDARLPMGSGAVLLYSKDAEGVGGVLAERFYGGAGGALAIAGVTGTNGKTTIAHLVQQIVKHARIKCGLIGTVVIDDGRERGAAAMTTPPAIELSRTLATMVEHECLACAMEVSSHALDQGRTSAVGIDGAGFTNLTGDHLDYHKTVESYTEAKVRLFSSLKSGAVAMINVDDAAGGVMIDACGDGVEVMRCSMEDSGVEWFGEIVERSIDGMGMRVVCPHGVVESSVGFFGGYNAGNVLIALGLADVLLGRSGVDVEARMVSYGGAMRGLRLPRGRLERVDGVGDDVGVFVDFAHSDDSIRSCLGAVKTVMPERSSLWCVFGCGGDRDRSKRARMGRVACSGADRVVLTSDNPRSEKPSQIVDDVLGGLDETQRGRVDVQIDRAVAIGFAIENAEAGDVIVIAGKGHEAEQVMMDRWGRVRAHEFDDVEHAKDGLRARRLAIDVDAGVES